MATNQTVVLDPNGGEFEGGGLTLYFNRSSHYWYTRADSTSQSDTISYIDLPVREQYRCTGFYEYSGGIQVEQWVVPVDNGGLPTRAFLWRAMNTTQHPPGTIYAEWEPWSNKITLNRSCGTGGTGEIYSKVDAAGIYFDWQCTSSSSSVSVPARSGYAFDGYWTSANGGTQYIYADGSFAQGLAQFALGGDATLYAHWRELGAITVNANGGSGGTSVFYYDSESGKFYSDAALSNEITAIEIPSKSGALFDGCHENGVERIAADGTISAWTPSGNVTVVAQWRVVVDITFDKGSGTGGASGLKYDSSEDAFFVAGDTEPVDSIVPPLRQCYRFLGYFSAQSGGTKYIDEVGGLTSAFLALSITEGFTIYAQWERISYKATVNANGGSAPQSAFFCDGTNAVFYLDDQLNIEISTLQMPTRSGYSCTGLWTAGTGGSKAVDSDGTILCGVFGTNTTFYAQWQIRSYLLSFNANGGSVSPTSKSVTWNAAVGDLPTPTPPQIRSGAAFEGWLLNGAVIDANYVWLIDGDGTAVARWATSFSNVTDFFGLASSDLVPIDSDNGDTIRRVAVAHGGKYESGINATGPIWRNPSVTYLVVADTTISVKLGKATAATFTGSGENRRMSVSGYMITSVEISTEDRRFPTVKVSATANEGANSVNNFGVNANKFNVSVPVAARARAQNLLGAISGGVYLRRVQLSARCDPVVCEENLSPCASDIVNGRYELSADTLAVNGESGPTMASASGTNGGFALVGAPRSEREGDYRRYTVTARREMV